MKEISFVDGLACRCRIIDEIVEPHIEAIKRLIGVGKFPQIGVVLCKVRGRYPQIVAVDVADEL